MKVFTFLYYLSIPASIFFSDVFLEKKSIPFSDKIAVQQYDTSSIPAIANGVLSVDCNNWLNTPAVNSSVSIGDLDVSGNQITVEAVINRTAAYLPGGGNNTEGDVVSKHNTFSDVNYLLRPNHAYITTTNGFFGTPDICDIELNKTYHVAMVYDGTSLKFYRDGFLMSQIAATGSLVQNNWQTRIGWYEPQGFTTQFIGYINEVRIWNVARTQSEIKAYMNTSLPSPTTQTGLLAYYQFDNLLNKQGNAAHNGTLNGNAAINAINPSCDFVPDSCQIASVDPCSNWLNMPDKLTGVTIGDLDITGNQLTVEAMCNATDIYELSRALVSKHEYPGDINYFLCPDLAEITTTDGYFSVSSPCGFVSHKTYHVAMVYNGSTLKLYRNGFLMNEIPASGNLVTNNWPTTIGEYAYSMYYGLPNISNIFKGYINEVRIWNVARTQQELRTYMNTSLPNPSSIPGLQAYYTFDNLSNKQGNAAFDGVLHAAATINNTNPNCLFVEDSCAAGDCSTTNNWLKMPNALSGVTIGDLDITGNQVTIEANCNATGDTTRALVSKHRDPSDVNYFLCPDLAQITTTNGFYSVTSPCTYLNNKTYHVALVYDGANLKLYRNGFLMGSTPATGNLITNNWPTTIGEYAYSMNNGLANISNIFKGVINEVRIWNIARTQQELRTYMNTSLPNPAANPGLQAYYVFDDLLNKQGNAAYNGALHGAATIHNNNPNCLFVEDSCSTVVPVTITNFSVKPLNNSIQIGWHTDMEESVVKYVIQRSTIPGGPFLEIGTVTAKSGSVNNYSFLDTKVNPNVTYYYRLYIVDVSGKNKYTQIKNGLIDEKNAAVIVYPNPSSGHLTIHLAKKENDVIIKVYNAKGQLVSDRRISNTLNNNIYLDINKFSTGTYWLEIITPSYKTTRKVLKL